MTSPAHSISSDDEESRELAELKARHEAEMRKAAERKAQKDQERRERREREKREQEEREVMTRRIREVGKAVAEVARGLAETDQEQEEREKEALRRTRTAELPTEAEVEAPAGNYEGGQKDEKGPGHGAPETEVDDDGDVEEGAPGSAMQKSPRRKVITSRPNTTEVIILRLAPKSREPEDSVSLARRPKSGN